jgi:hypothetical protein
VKEVACRVIHQHTATNRRVILSRDRIIARKRNKLTIIAVAGALSVVTAGSAAATAWPAARSANTALSKVTIPAGRTAATQLRAQENYLGQQRASAIAGRQAVATLLAQWAKAAGKAVAVEAAQQREAAGKAVAAEAAQQRMAARLAAAQHAAAQRAAAQQAASHQTAVMTPAIPSSPQNIAADMLASYGWSSRQFSCLQPLWTAESNWRVGATNPSTGAYGIPQALPGSRMASAGRDWRSSAATQIRWGLGYIKSTYGSPCAAWDHQRSTSWY